MAIVSCTPYETNTPKSMPDHKLDGDRNYYLQ